MDENVWKHLPYAIYLDTNALRESGQRLEAPWFNELLSITRKYGIDVCISKLVLAEWCEYVAGTLRTNLAKLRLSMEILGHYGISVRGVQPREIELPEKKRLLDILSGKLAAAGIDAIPDWDGPLSDLLVDAVAKKPPFEEGGKGLCDAVILESYVQHARGTFPQPRVLVVSRDSAVKRSAGRFADRGVAVEFVDKEDIVETVKSLLDDEVATAIEREKAKLAEYVIAREAEVLAFVRATPLRITGWMLDSPYRASTEDRVEGTIESVLSVKPTGIADVIGGAPTYGGSPSPDRYPLRIFVDIELDVVVREHGFDYGALCAASAETRAVVQPDALDGKSPVPLKTTAELMARQATRTIRRNVTVLATLDAEKEKAGVLDGFRIEGID